MRIRFGEPISLEVPVEQLPPDSLKIENNSQIPLQDQFRVYIVWDVYKQMRTHVNENPNIESGGILVGYPFKEKRGNITFVVIVAAIRQDSQNRGRAYFTVGPEEIANARTEMERNYPGLVAVGWYHSHPGHGIFLSGQDMTIVRSIYNEDWHIALVIDPKHRAEGIFVGPEGKQIGGEGNHPLKSTWFPIKSEPDSVKAIALYNQICEAIREQQQQQAIETIERLESLLERSEQLMHWGYRDLNVLKSGLFVEEVATLPDNDPFSKANPPVVTPEPARDKKKKAKSGRWPLWASLISTAVFAVFFIFTVIWYPGNVNTLIVLGLTATISLVAVITAVYLIVSRVAIIETVAAVILMSIILLGWMGFASTQIGKFNIFIDTTETPTSVPTIEPTLQTTFAIETPTLAPMLIPTLLPTTTEEMSEILPTMTLITNTVTFTPIFSESLSPDVVSPTITLTNPGVP